MIRELNGAVGHECTDDMTPQTTMGQHLEGVAGALQHRLINYRAVQLPLL